MTGYAAIGYALMAADELKMSESDKEKLWKLMLSIMDTKTEKEAENRFLR